MQCHVEFCTSYCIYSFFRTNLLGLHCNHKSLQPYTTWESNHRDLLRFTFLRSIGVYGNHKYYYSLQRDNESGTSLNHKAYIHWKIYILHNSLWFAKELNLFLGQHSSKNNKQYLNIRLLSNNILINRTYMKERSPKPPRKCTWV